jgi:hypothetical protein
MNDPQPAQPAAPAPAATQDRKAGLRREDEPETPLTADLHGGCVPLAACGCYIKRTAYRE